VSNQKNIKSLIVIAVCILLIIFGIYDQYQSIKTGTSFFEILNEVTEGN